MKDIKTKEDVKKLFVQNLDTGEYKLTLGVTVNVSEELWLELNDEESKMLLTGALHNMRLDLVRKTEEIEGRIE